MRIAIIGSRENSWKHPQWVRRCIDRYVQLKMSTQDTLVSGGANGVDTWAVQSAKAMGVPVIEHLADWAKHGKGAGFKRNWQIIHDADLIVAFWDGQSKGTEHTINAARSENKQVLIIKPEEHIFHDWIEESDYAF